MASRGKKVGEGEKLDAKTINKVGVWGRREGLGGWVGGGGVVQVGGAEPPFQPASPLNHPATMPHIDKICQAVCHSSPPAAPHLACPAWPPLPPVQ